MEVAILGRPDWGGWVLLLAAALPALIAGGACLWILRRRALARVRALTRRLEETGGALGREEARSTAMARLAGGVAHEFNNVLGTISGNAELLTQEIPSESSSRELVDNIMTACARAANITGKLLAFGRRGKLLSIPVDLNLIVEDVLELLGTSGSPGIHINRTSANPTCWATGDPGQLEIALLNIALNGQESMPDGGELLIATSPVDLRGREALELDLPPGPYAMVEIRDTGIGMTPEVRQRIFEPFFTTKTEGRSGGLGLAAVLGIVQEHKGAIQVQTRPGAGSTFRLFLPALQAHSRTSGPSATLEDPPGSAHILFVDDDEQMRNLARDMLGRSGHRITLCGDGSEAVEFFLENSREVDLVILDMVMPRMGGRDTFMHLQAIRPDVKVLITTGYSLGAEIQELIEAGALGLIPKPFRQARLTRLVTAALSAQDEDAK